MRTTLMIAAAAALTSLGGVASAQDYETRSVSVSTNGLDLTDANDILKLHQKIARAAYNVCEVRTTGRTTLTERNNTRECAANAIDSAVQTAGLPGLNVLHAELSPGQRYSRSARRVDANVLARVEAAGTQLAAVQNTIEVAQR